MSPTSPPSRSSSLAAPFALILFLLGWGMQSACAVEDTVATIITPDGSVGPFEEEPGAQAAWPGEEVPDAGTGETPDGGSPGADTVR